MRACVARPPSLPSVRWGCEWGRHDRSRSFDLTYLAPAFSLVGVWLGFLAIGGTMALALAVFFAARWLLASGAEKETKDLAESVNRRIAALHGLILALVFAQELVNLNQIKDAVAREGALAGDVFFDLKRYDAEATRPAQIALARYVGVVIEDEWDSLATRQQLSGDAWGHWEAVYHAILELEPSSLRQEELKSILVADIRQISALRRARENYAQAAPNALFILAAVAGVVLTSIAYFPYAPRRQNLLMLSIFSAYVGLVIFFILAFSNPYREPGVIAPNGLLNLFQGEVGQLYRMAGR